MKMQIRGISLLLGIVLFLGLSVNVQGNHSWNGYHWARTSNPFTLKLGDNVTSVWDPILATSSSDWTQSTVLNTTIVAGSTTARRCKAPSGRVEVCNSTYGFNGWLGIAGITVSGGHITSGYVKLNDSYFNTSTYNSTAWRNLVSCQEVGHTFGLDHQDENFDNANLGTCMDYTNNPGTNQHPNSHDYQQLVDIYSHLDSTTTVGALIPSADNFIMNAAYNDGDDQDDWGTPVRRTADGRTILYVRDLGNGVRRFTFVFPVPGGPQDRHDF
jgi:hypothetical protein